MSYLDLGSRRTSVPVKCGLGLVAILETEMIRVIDRQKGRNRL